MPVVAIWIVGGLIGVLALDQVEETVDGVGSVARNDLLPLAAMGVAAVVVLRSVKK